MKRIILFALTFTTILSSFAQKSIIDNAEDKIKIFNAHQSYMRGHTEDVRKALGLFRDVYSNRQSDGEIAYWIGACNLALGDIEHAREFYEKADQINTNSHVNLHLDLGKVYQMDGETDKAIEQFEKYKSANTNPKTLKESDVDHFLEQCRTAKDLTAKAIDVTFENMGQIINSQYDDKRPSLSADGKTFIFTSRRPRDRESVVDKEGDGKYFEDIYISRWDSAKNGWEDPDLIPGAVNTETHDAACSISPDGKTIFLYKNDAIEARGGDIWYSKVGSSGKWGTPKPMGKPVNTTYWEDGACLSPDGSTLFYISEAPGKTAIGKGDIYMAKRKGKSSEWEKPVNLGAVVNTTHDEGAPYIAADGKTLFFCSEGHNSMGSYDIFKTTVDANGVWSKPENLGYPINTIGAEKSFIISTDGNTAYIASDRKGGFGERDIYKVDVSRYNLIGKLGSKNTEPALSILKGTIYTSDTGQPLEADITFTDAAGNKAGSTTSSTEGDYFITLKGNAKYTIKVEVKGYKPAEETVELKEGKGGTIYSLVKHFLMNKK